MGGGGLGKELSRQWGMAMCGPSPSRGAAGEPRDTKGGDDTTPQLPYARGEGDLRCPVSRSRGEGERLRGH